MHSTVTGLIRTLPPPHTHVHTHAHVRTHTHSYQKTKAALSDGSKKASGAVSSAGTKIK